MRIGTNDQPECAVAKSVEISEDYKVYLFHLRECKWSNGNLVRAEDFVYAWKKVLSPHFVTPFAYYLYSLKNAQAAKKGEISLNAIGVQAIDTKTLRVELEYPVPYFLELVTLPAFFPISETCDSSYPHWASAEGEHFVCVMDLSI